MVKNMTMLVVNIAEIKAKLSEYLDAVSQGERIVICKRNRPVAELRAVEQARTEPRPIGMAKRRLTIPDSFFEPLPDDVLDGFDGAGTSAHELRVAETAPGGGYAARKRRAKHTS